MQQPTEHTSLTDELLPDREQQDTPTQDETIQSAILAAKAASHADALAIAELCQLSGHPERTASFLAEGASESQVRRALLAARATSTEISSTIAAAHRQNSSAANPLMAAVKKISGKE